MMNIDYQKIGKSLCDHIDSLSNEALLEELKKCGLNSQNVRQSDLPEMSYTGRDAIMYIEDSYNQNMDWSISFSVNNTWFKKGA